MPSNYLIISFCVNVGRAACRWPAPSQKIISHVARRWARVTITSLIPALERFNAYTVRRACVVVVPGAERTCGLGIARAIVATLPAVAAAVCRRSGGRCGATARYSPPTRSIRWPWKFQPLSTGGGTPPRLQPIATNIPHATTPMWG